MRRAEPARPHFGDQVARRRDERPAVAAQVGEIDLERAADVLIEDVGGPPQIVWDDRHAATSASAAEPGREVRRVERGGTRRRTPSRRSSAPVKIRICVRSAGSGGANRMRPRAEQDDRGRAVRDLRDERRAGGHLDRQVRCRRRRGCGRRTARGVQRQPEEARDVRDRLQALDAPVVRIGLGGRRPDVDAPGGQLRLDAALDEDSRGAADCRVARRARAGRAP